jgi:uncharacterized protein DUF3551
MRMFLAAAALLLAASASDRATAVEYPWCAHYDAGNGGINCGFTSLAQCRASLSGNGGECQRNYAYTGPTQEPLAQPRRQRRQ